MRLRQFCMTDITANGKYPVGVPLSVVAFAVKFPFCKRGINGFAFRLAA
jgi:hypothetical protein